MNIIAWLEYELTYYDSAVHRFNHYTTRTPLQWLIKIYIYIYIYHHHHHVMLLAQISLTLSRHFSLSFIASDRSSGLHPISSHSCWMYVRAGRYETIEEMKEAVMKVIDTLTQEDFHQAFPKLLETVQQVHCRRRRLLRRGLKFHVCTINKSAYTKKSGNLSYASRK